MLQNSAYRAYFFTRLSSQLATQMMMTTVSWQIFELTKDPLSLGLLGFFEVISAIGLAPVGGHWVDRLNKKQVYSWSLGLSLLISLVLWWSSLQGQLSDAKIHTYVIYALVFFVGVVRAFINPASFALVGEILKRDSYIKGTTWNTLSWQMAFIFGPAIAGLFYAVTKEASWNYLICSALFMISQIFMLQIPYTHKKLLIVKEPFKESLLKGIRFVWKTPLLLGAMTLDMFAVLFAGAVALLPMFADRLGVGPEGLGMLRAAPSIGALILTLFLVKNPPQKKTGLVMLWSVAAYSACMIFFALSTNFGWCLFLLAASGAFDAISVVVRGSILQLSTPDNMRGRVSAVSMMFIASSNELGNFEAGIAAKLFGLVPSVVLGGGLSLLVVALVAFKNKSLRKFELHWMK